MGCISCANRHSDSAVLFYKRLKKKKEKKDGTSPWLSVCFENHSSKSIGPGKLN